MTGIAKAAEKYVVATGETYGDCSTEESPCSTIQDAIDNASPYDTINVAAGNYKEQLVINKSLTLQGAGAGTTIIEAPDTMTATTWTHNGSKFQAVIEVNGTSTHDITVNISGFTIDGLNKYSASPRYTGIVYHNADGTVSNNTITKFGSDPLAGADGWGIFVVEGSNVAISNNTVDKWGKGGIVVDGDDDIASTDVTATITENTIIGAGDILTSAQNGIQISRGATGTVSGNTISACVYPDPNKKYSATGILVYNTDDVTVTNNILTSNETGVYVQDQNTNGGTAGNVVSNNTIKWSKYGIYILRSSKTQILDNTIDGSTYFGVRIGSGSANTTIENNTIKNSAYDGIHVKSSGAAITDVLITGNTITDNNIAKDSTSGGIFIGQSGSGTMDSSQVTVYLNNIVGNKQYGIFNDSATGTLDATNNWWGDPSGPSGNGHGTGDTISDKVNYEPWLNAPYPEGKPIRFTSVEEGTVTNGTFDATEEANTEVVVTGSATITVAKYSDNPGTGFTGDIGKYIDVYLTSDSDVTEIEIRLYYTDAEVAGKDESSLKLYWWDGSNSKWSPCSDTGVNTASNYIWANITSTSTPALTNLGVGGIPATPFAAGGNALVTSSGGGIPAQFVSTTGVVLGTSTEAMTEATETLTIDELIAKVNELKAQLQELQNKLAQLTGKVVLGAATYEGIPQDFSFKTNLKEGDSSNDVKYLQIILKAEVGAPTYPENVPATGWFGPITEAAVIKFQEKYASEILAPWNLTEGTGLVGSTTRAKLNQMLGH